MEGFERPRPRTPRVVPGQKLASGKRQGLSAARVEAEVARQEGKCILCLRPLGANFAVDHDHKLAAEHGHDPNRGCERCFRGITCHRCNSILGWGWDDPEFFDRVAAYIRLARAGRLR